MTRRLRIALATAGRFHLLDLARELDTLGHDVAFYSYVPGRRAAAFGLPARCHRSLLPYAAPVLAADRIAFGAAAEARERMMYKALNYGLMRTLEPCDLLICMSGIYLEAARDARERFGAAVWLERGSVHILAQDAILKAVPGATRPSRLAIARELAGYDLADRIVVPSSHVAQTFAQDASLHAKLFRNPYGVDLAAFPQRGKPPSKSGARALFVGTWSLRKGCDLLAAAIRRLPEARLTHVGAIGDCPFPAGDPQFRHVDAMPQQALAAVYAEADMLILPSREEGFGLVLAQALACGLPVICSDRTGGLNLAHTPALAERIGVVPSGDVEALAGAIARLRDRIACDPFAPLAERDRATLSWAAYGRRYADAIAAAFATAGGDANADRNVA